jgi:RNA polymerase sigma-70 factor (ECF subfamily)
VELEDVFRAHQQAVFAYFYRVVGNAHDAEELTQETFVRACGAAIRFRGDSKVSTWLFGIARRVLLEASRAGLFERPAELDPEAAVPDERSAPEERLDLVRALATLGVADRESLVMVDVLGFEPIEVAGMLEITPEAFRVRLHRARNRLREAYGDG